MIFKKEGDNHKDKVVQDAVMQYIAREWAQKFNEVIGNGKKIEMIPSDIFMCDGKLVLQIHDKTHNS